MLRDCGVSWVSTFIFLCTVCPALIALPLVHIGKLLNVKTFAFGNKEHTTD